MMKFNLSRKMRFLFTISLAMVFLSCVFFAIKASANQTIFKLTSVSINEKSADVITTIDDFDSDDINLNVEFHRIDDYIVYKLVLKNTSDNDYTLKTISDNNSNSYISYEYDKHENEVIKSGDSLEILLKAIYKNEQTDITNRNQIENFKLLFSFENEDGVPVDGNIDINPKTGDNIYIYYIIAGASLIGIAVINIKFKNNKVKNLIILIVLLTPVIVKAAESSFTILIKSETKLFDKLVIKYNDGEDVTKVVNYGDPITEPTAPSKNGYTFDGWYLNNELYDFSKPVTKDANLVPKYTANPTTYTVKHKYENIDGSYEEVDKTIDALTDEEVTAPLISKTGFNSPPAQSVIVAYDGSTHVEYVYTRKEFNVIFNTNGGTSVSSVTRKYDEEIGTLPETIKDNYILDGWYTKNDGGNKVSPTDRITSETNYYARWNKSIYFAEIFNANIELTRGDNSQVVITNFAQIGEEISYTSSDDSVATVDDAGNITATGKGSITITLEGKTSHLTKVVNVLVINENVTVHFNSHGGTSVNDIEVENETKIGTKLPNNPTKEHYIFDAWYTTDSFATKVTSDTVVNGETTYHAKWLDTVYNATITNSNIELVRNNGEQINISNISTIGEDITYTSSDETVATVSSDGYVTALKKGTATITVKGATSNATKEVSITVYNEQINVSFDTHEGSIVNSISMEAGTKIGNKLPSTDPTKDNYIFDAWYTTDSYSTKVTSDTVINESTTLHAKWDKSIYFANITNTTINMIRYDQAQINIDNLNEIKENITYSSNDESVATVEADGRVTANGKGTATITLTGSISNQTKTVTVNVNNEKVFVHFNSHGGTNVSDIEVENETAIGDNIPTGVTKDHYIFDAWYTTDSYSAKVTSSTIVNGETTYHAKWDNSLYQATLKNDEFNLVRNEEGQIVITNISTIAESLTYTSSDDAIATVSSSGLITAHAKGSATITIEGSISHETKTVTVNVTNEKVTIHFDSHGGTSVSDIEVENETKIGDNLPSNITKNHYLFDAWYTTDSYETKVTSDTVVNGNTTYHANWNKTVYDLDILNENISLTNQGTGSITINNASAIGETYTFTSDDPTQVTVDNEGNLTALSITEYPVIIRITGNTSGEVRTVAVSVVPRKYTVSFNTHASSTISSIEVNEGETLSSIPTPINGSNTFVGWFYNEDGTGDMLTTSTVINESHEYHAKWAGMICKKATTLTTATCDATATNQGCRAAGFAAGGTIVFGNINSSDTLVPGDAFDCDVDGEGYTKRFYYVRTVDNKAVLIYNYNFQDGAEGNDKNYLYTDALNELPSTTTWDNLPITFENDKAARFITIDDLTDMTGLDFNGLKTAKSLENYKFLFENTSYHLANGRSTTWVKELNVGDRIRIHKNERALNISDNSSVNSVRPVIEVPLDKIDDSYIVKFEYEDDQNVTNTIYKTVAKGSKIGELPSVSKSHYVSVGWYRNSDFTGAISENTIPEGYETYYAKWNLSAQYASFPTDNYEIPLNGHSSIVVLDTEEVEPLIYTSNDESVVIVDSEGNIIAQGVGETTITVEGAFSHTTRTLNVKVVDGQIKFTVSFDTHGGTPVNDIEVDAYTPIGNMPSTTKDGNTFMGWYDSELYNVEITGDLEIIASVTLHAKWMPNNTVCEMNNTYYSDLQTAIDEAPATKTTIKLLADVQVSSVINTYDKNITKDLVIDLNGHSISPTSEAGAINIFKNKAKLELKNGTITSNKQQGVIDVESGGTLVVRDLTVTTTGERATIYNSGGTVTITGDTYLSSNAKGNSNGNFRATVQNISGTTRITGGTIVSTSSGYAVTATAGTVIIGTEDGIASSSSPIIIGETKGVRIENSASVFFYDGIIKAITSIFESNVIPSENIETGYKAKTDDTETIGTKVYKLYYLVLDSDNYVIQLNAKGGEVDPVFISIEPGNTISELPTPTKGIYHFDGWYYDEEYNNPVDLSIAPTESTEYFAKWSYESSDEIVSFNINSPAMQTYFANVETWVQGATSENNTAFINNLRAVFDANSCSYCSLDDNANSCPNPSAGTYCDQAIGKATGITTGITVRESNENTKIKNGPIASYVTVSDGIIYNMIPGTTYYWESNVDSNVYGYIKATGNRRTITSSVRNVRDLGGLEVSFIRDNVTKTGTINYGRLYRGAQLMNGQSDVDSLLKLGITRELDLRVKTEGTNPMRLPKHDRCNSNCSNISDADDIIMTNYLVNPNTHLANYLGVRKALKATMEFIVNDKDNVYFHCTIGTDRTGTLAYFLEGLLGVDEEDRLEDYELTYYYGLLNRTRFHDYLSNSGINPRFYSMYKTYNTKEKIYDWFMHGRFCGGIDINALSKSDLLLYASDLEITGVSSSNTEEEIINAINAQLELDDQLVQAFRDEMITYTN